MHRLDANTIAKLHTWIREDIQLAATRIDFVQIALQLFEQVVIRRNRDDRHVFVHERQWPMFQFAGSIRLRMNV